MKPATSIEKVCRVLDAFRSRPNLGVTDISERTGLLPSDVHRILSSPAVFGYIEKDPESRRYQLGLELLRLGHLVHERLELREVARPLMQKLAQRMEATANLAVLDAPRDEVTFIEQIDSPAEQGVGFRVGAPASPYSTALGKVLLAHLDAQTVRRVVRKFGLKRTTARTIVDPKALEQELERIRKDGVAFDREEAAEGASCLGVPLRNYAGHVVAAMSLSMSTDRMREIGENELITTIKRSAARISAGLGYDPHWTGRGFKRQ